MTHRHRWVFTTLLALAPAAGALFPASPVKPISVAEAARETRKRRTRGERFVNEITPEIKKAIHAAIRTEFPRAGVHPSTVKTVESSHYVVLTNSPKLTKTYNNTLEGVYAFVKKEYRFKAVKGFLFVFVFHTRDEYVNYIVNKFNFKPEAARKTGGLAANGLFYTFYNNAGAKRTLVHEATHQIVFARMGVVNGGNWLQEGLAVYIENKYLGKDPLAEMKKRITEDRYYYFNDFLGIKNLLFDPKGYGRLNYAQAGSMVDFMINGRYRRHFQKYLEKVKKNQSPEKKICIAAIEKGFQVKLLRFENGWRRFCKAPVRKRMGREK